MESSHPRDRVEARHELAARSQAASFAYLPAALGVIGFSPELHGRPWLCSLVLLVFGFLTYVRFKASRDLAESAQDLAPEPRRRFDITALLCGAAWAAFACLTLMLDTSGSYWQVLTFGAIIVLGALSSMNIDHTLFTRFSGLIVVPTTVTLLLRGEEGDLAMGCVIPSLWILVLVMGRANNRRYWSTLLQNRVQLEELDSARERLEMVVSGSNLGTFDWQPELHQIHLDDKLPKTLGLPPEGFAPFHGSLADFVHPEDVERVGHLLRNYLGDQQAPLLEIEVRFQDVDRQDHWFLFRGKVVKRSRDGRAVRMAGTYQDITAKRRADDALAGLRSQVEQAEKLKTLGVLAGGVAHEFNNLLMTIHGNLEMLEWEVSPDDEGRESFESARQAALEASKLCHQLLAYAGKERITVVPVSLNRLVQSTVSLIRPTLDKSLDIRLDLAEDLPKVQADSNQLRQLLLALLTNAWEAMEGLKGVIVVSTSAHSSRELRTRHPNLAEGTYVCLTVRDQGHGMSPETQQKIFDPFFSTKFMGRGLGLASALGAARTHGGDISFESEQGVGSIFSLVLPMHEVTPAVASSPREDLVLVVDDDAGVRGVCRTVLKRAGIGAVEAASGELALELLAADREAITLVLLDASLSGKSGMDVLRELQDLRPNLPVVLMSGYPPDQLLHHSELRETRFLQKPFSRQELLDQVRRALSDEPAAP